MGRNVNEEIEIDLMDLFYLLRSRLWIIILSGIIMASVAGLVSSFMITPLYTSSTKLYILTKSTSITSLADIQLGSQLTQDYMVLVKSRPVVTKVIENLELDMSYEELAGIITISNPSNTRILEIRAEYPNAFIAKQIVDEFAVVSVSQIAKIMDTQEPTIVEEGFASPIPSSPNRKKNIAIGGLLGIFAAAGILIVLRLMDDTIKSSDDIEKYLGINTLGLLPIESGAEKITALDRKKRKQLGSKFAESNKKENPKKSKDNKNNKRRNKYEETENKKNSDTVNTDTELQVSDNEKIS